ncbi:MAG: NAD(P)/FAD-dependent oxidoreductase [Anaerolineae bacterium]
MQRRYLIVGSGAAGIAAAESIRRYDPRGDITLVSEDGHGYYSRPGLAYLLTGEVPERQLHPFDNGDFRRLNVRLLQARAVALDPGAHRLTLYGGDAMPFDRLLIATGSAAIPLPVPGAELEGVVKLDDLDDARRILGRSRRGRTAVVVGGGITALELVEGFRARQVTTHYLMRGDRYWSNVLDEDESRLVEARLRDEGVQIHYHAEVGAIVGRGEHVVGVTTADGHEIPCDMVACAIGVRPRLELARSAGLATDRGIVTDDMLRTSASDVYAAGDVAQVLDPLTGKAGLDTLWSAAVAQGRAAGANMAGQTTPYRKSAPLNVTRLAWLATTIIGTVGSGSDRDVSGIARGDSETWRQSTSTLVAHSSDDGNRLRVVIGERTLLGAVVMGDQSLSFPLYHLIAEQADVSAIRDRLTEPAANLAAVLAQFWAERRRSHVA